MRCTGTRNCANNQDTALIHACQHRSGIHSRDEDNLRFHKLAMKMHTMTGIESNMHKNLHLSDNYYTLEQQLLHLSCIGDTITLKLCNIWSTESHHCQDGAPHIRNKNAQSGKTNSIGGIPNFSAPGIAHKLHMLGLAGANTRRKYSVRLVRQGERTLGRGSLFLHSPSAYNVQGPRVNGHSSCKKHKFSTPKHSSRDILDRGAHSDYFLWNISNTIVRVSAQKHPRKHVAQHTHYTAVLPALY